MKEFISIHEIFNSLTAGIHFKLIHPQTKLQVFFKYVQGRSQTGSTGAINPPLPIGAVSETQWKSAKEMRGGL